MMFPFESLSGLEREIGLVVAVLLGMAFGFVLERAGFGRSTKLAAQFYFYDMTVFKVMFTAIVTGMLGIVVVGGLGLVDVGHVSRLVVSGTFLWPMIFGGLLLGVGFIISGYCPGTSLVSAASGHVDGMVAFAGVIVGSVLFGEMYPLVKGFFYSGDMGQVFLCELLGIPRTVLAAGVAVMAIGCFLGAEVVERIATQWVLGHDRVEIPAGPRRLTIAVLSVASAASLMLMFLPVGRHEALAESPAAEAQEIDVQTLAQRVLDEPWQLRIVDLRSRDAFVEKRIPGSEHSSVEALDELGLQYSRGIKDLVLVGDEELRSDSAPEAALKYPGRVFVLDGGFAAWQRFALTAPALPPTEAPPEQIAAYRFQSAVHSAMTGVQAPPPPKTTTKFTPPPKRKAGGCS